MLFFFSHSNFRDHSGSNSHSSLWTPLWAVIINRWQDHQDRGAKRPGHWKDHLSTQMLISKEFTTFGHIWTLKHHVWVKGLQELVLFNTLPASMARWLRLVICFRAESQLYRPELVGYWRKNLVEKFLLLEHVLNDLILLGIAHFAEGDCKKYLCNVFCFIALLSYCE